VLHQHASLDNLSAAQMDALGRFIDGELANAGKVSR